MKPEKREVARQQKTTKYIRSTKRCEELEKRVDKLEEIVMFDNIQIAKYDDEVKNLKKRIKELENVEKENSKLKSDVQTYKNLYYDVCESKS